MLVALPFAGGVTEVGAKAHVAPPGRPVQERATALAKPLVEVTVQVLFALAALRMLKLGGLQRDVKSGVGAPPQLGNL